MCELKNRHWSAFVANKKQDEGWMCCSRWVTKGDAYHYLMINTQVWFHTTCEFTFSFPFSLLFFFFYSSPEKKEMTESVLCLPEMTYIYVYLTRTSCGYTNYDRCCWGATAEVVWDVVIAPRDVLRRTSEERRVSGRFDTGDRCSHSGAVFVKPNRTIIM